MITELLEWSKEILVPLGPYGLFIIAFMESSFFPIPPDLLLIPLVLADPVNALFYGAVATIGSVLGSMLGYFIGIKGGRPILLRFAGEKTVSVEKYFNKYGTAAIGIAGFTPIPYKIFTIAAGVFRHSIAKLILISIISRGGRFFLEAIFLMLWGAEIIIFMEEYFGILTFGITGIAIVVYYLYKKRFCK